MIMDHFLFLVVMFCVLICKDLQIELVGSPVSSGPLLVLLSVYTSYSFVPDFSGGPPSNHMNCLGPTVLKLLWVIYLCQDHICDTSHWTC